MKRLLAHLWRIVWAVGWRAAVAAFALLCIAVVYVGWEFFFSSPPRVPVGENVPADESLYFAQIVNNGEQIVNNTRDQQGDGVYRRDAHAKTHGCAAASFDVLKTFDRRILYGLFNEAKTYKAWIRFSSGDYGVESDWKPDARGMAIKVLGVPGKKLLDGEQNATTQDFLMINYPVFFLSSIPEYMKLTTLQSKGDSTGYFFGAGALPPHTGGKLNPLNWHMREFRLGMGVLGAWPPWRLGPRNLLDTRFYSMSAYRLGNAQFVKYSAKPVACAAGGSTPSSLVGLGAGALHDSLKSQLASDRKYCFDFMVQIQAQGPGKYMPVEDPTIEWKESDSPFIPVARIEIGKQNIDTAIGNGFCENLSFTPWHSLPEHEPAGGLNRARKVVYQNIARYRRCSNGKYFGEPKDDGSQQFTTQACDATKPVPDVQPGTSASPAKGDEHASAQRGGPGGSDTGAARL